MDEEWKRPEPGSAEWREMFERARDRFGRYFEHEESDIVALEAALRAALWPERP